MELTQIRYFLHVAHTQHMTHSAEQLHIAQPALSQSIKRLENDLNVTLFEARGRNIVLTPCGQYLKERLQPIVAELDALPLTLRQLAETEENTLRLCVSAASTLISEAVIAYKKQHEQVNFRFLQTEDSDHWDISVTTRLFHKPSVSENRDNLFVCTEKIYLAVPDAPPYQGRTSIALREVAGEDFISLMGFQQLRAICDRLCQHAGFTPHITFESDNPAVVRNMIASHMGIGFWPQFSWGHMEHTQMRLLEISEPVCQRDLLITCHKDEHHPLVADFYRFLTTFVTAHMENPSGKAEK